jgi:hypothetical protein
MLVSPDDDGGAVLPPGGVVFGESFSESRCCHHWWCNCCCKSLFVSVGSLFFFSFVFRLCASLMSRLALDIILLQRLGVFGIMILIYSLYQKKTEDTRTRLISFRVDLEKELILSRSRVSSFSSSPIPASALAVALKGSLAVELLSWRR